MDSKDTRYFIEVDVKTHKIVRFTQQRKQDIDLAEQPNQHKVFLTKGQYEKLVKRLGGEG